MYENDDSVKPSNTNDIGPDVVIPSTTNPQPEKHKPGFPILPPQQPPIFPPVIPTTYGWICPKCGAVWSPQTQSCPNCVVYTFSPVIS